MDKGRGRRWIAEGKSLRGENEMEWDSDGDGEMDTESKTMLQRKFAGSERRKEGGGKVMTEGVMSRHMEICFKVGTGI